MYNIISLTVKDQQDKVRNRIKEYEEQLRLIKIVLKEIEKFEGKKITKHVETHFKKIFPDYYVSLDDRFSMFQLNLTPNNVTNESFYFKPILGYKTSNVFSCNSINTEEIKKHNQCYLLNEERIPKLKEGLNRVIDLIKKRDQAIKLIEEIDAVACKYEMDYDFKLQK